MRREIVARFNFIFFSCSLSGEFGGGLLFWMLPSWYAEIEGDVLELLIETGEKHFVFIFLMKVRMKMQMITNALCVVFC